MYVHKLTRPNAQPCCTYAHRVILVNKHNFHQVINVLPEFGPDSGRNGSVKTSRAPCCSPKISRPCLAVRSPPAQASWFPDLQSSSLKKKPEKKTRKLEQEVSFCISYLKFSQYIEGYLCEHQPHINIEVQIMIGTSSKHFKTSTQWVATFLTTNLVLGAGRNTPRVEQSAVPTDDTGG